MAIQGEGNYRIDYCTISDNAACNKWMPELACKLHHEMLESVHDVVAMVKKSVLEGLLQ